LSSCCCWAAQCTRASLLQNNCHTCYKPIQADTYNSIAPAAGGGIHMLLLLPLPLLLL
jgi:hypothetical protein